MAATVISWVPSSSTQSASTSPPASAAVTTGRLATVAVVVEVSFWLLSSSSHSTSPFGWLASPPTPSKPSPSTVLNSWLSTVTEKFPVVPSAAESLVMSIDSAIGWLTVPSTSRVTLLPPQLSPLARLMPVGRPLVQPSSVKPAGAAMVMVWLSEPSKSLPSEVMVAVRVPLSPAWKELLASMPSETVSADRVIVSATASTVTCAVSVALETRLLSLWLLALATRVIVPRSTSLSGGGMIPKLQLRLVTPGSAVSTISPSLTSVLSSVHPAGTPEKSYPKLSSSPEMTTVVSCPSTVSVLAWTDTSPRPSSSMQISSMPALSCAVTTGTRRGSDEESSSRRSERSSVDVNPNCSSVGPSKGVMSRSSPPLPWLTSYWWLPPF